MERGKKERGKEHMAKPGSLLAAEELLSSPLTPLQLIKENVALFSEGWTYLNPKG